MGYQCKSPAKINLFLKVLSKRPDGFHNIVSIVDVVSLFDIMHIEDTKDSDIVVEDNKGILPAGMKNTIYRTIALIKEHYNVERGVRVFVEKNIPIGSGLGGPSSNAATIMKELIKIWELSVDNRDLVNLARLIGADVPLFLYGKSCMIQGIGEQVSPVQLPHMWYVIVYPGFELKSKIVYEQIKIVLTKEENDIKYSKNFNNIHDVADILENDLEQVGISMCPQIGIIKERLIEAGAIGALMTGSGSSVFGLFKSNEHACNALSALQNMGKTFVVHSLEEA